MEAKLYVSDDKQESRELFLSIACSDFFNFNSQHVYMYNEVLGMFFSIPKRLGHADLTYDTFVAYIVLRCFVTLIDPNFTFQFVFAVQIITLLNKAGFKTTKIN